LGLLELAEGAKESLRQAALVAGKLGKGLSALAGDRRTGEVGLGLGAAGGQSLGEGFVVAAGLVERIGEGRGFEARDAAHAPLGVGELADEGLFEGVGGLEEFFEFGDERLEIGGIFAGQERGFRFLSGAETVFAGVLGGFGFAGTGARAGAALGVEAIGLELFLRGHDSCGAAGVGHAASREMWHR
jgi:hypothetical protein